MGLVAKAKKSARKAGKAFVPLDQNRNAALIGLTGDLGKFERLSKGSKADVKVFKSI